MPFSTEKPGKVRESYKVQRIRSLPSLPPLIGIPWHEAWKKARAKGLYTDIPSGEVYTELLDEIWLIASSGPDYKGHYADMPEDEAEDEVQKDLCKALEEGKSVEEIRDLMYWKEKPTRKMEPERMTNALEYHEELMLEEELDRQADAEREAKAAE